MILPVFTNAINRIPTRYQSSIYQQDTKYQMLNKILESSCYQNYQFSLLSRLYKISFMNTLCTCVLKKSKAFYSQSASSPLLTARPVI
jgi:hypothetical protein